MLRSASKRVAERRIETNWINRLELKFGKYAWPNLLRYMVGAQAVFYILEYAAAKGPGTSILPYLTLNGASILGGEWWRLATFYMMPPAWNPLFVIFYVFIVFMISDGMERAWGSFRINLFALLGWASHLAIAFAFPLWHVTPEYLVMAFLVAFSVHYGDGEILLMFFIPVKWRWIGWFIAGMMALALVTGPLPSKLAVLASAGVLMLFIGPWLKKEVTARRGAAKNRADWEAKQRPARALPSKACAQCGRDDADALARLCTCERCGEDGRFWCEEHLGPHLGK